MEKCGMPIELPPMCHLQVVIAVVKVQGGTFTHR